MTLPATPFRKDHVGNGVATSFLYDWKILSAAHLSVTRQVISTGIETPLVLGVDYTVTGVGNDGGGNVVYGVPTTPLPSGQKITILPNVPYEQDTDFTNQSSVLPEEAESMADKLGRQIKQIAEKLSRAVTLPVTDTGSPTDYINQMNQIYADTVSAKNAAQAAETDAESARDTILSNAGFIVVSSDLFGADTIGTVATDIASVIACANNMSAILVAPAAASSAANARDAAEDARDFAWEWSSQAEDVAVDDGVNPPGFSSYHYMKKAEGFAGGGLGKISANDTTAGYLNGKLVATADLGIGLVENNDGANETLGIGLSFSNFVDMTNNVTQTDSVLFYDLSVAAFRACQVSRLFKGISAVSAATDPQPDDVILISDTSASSNARSMVVSDFLKVTNTLTEDTTPDKANDFVMTYDASAGAAKKVKLNKIASSIFTSSDQTVTAAGALTIAHGLGVRPDIVQAIIVVTTAGSGYSIGDTIYINPGMNPTGTNNQGISITADTTNIYIRFGSATAPITVIHKTSGAATALAVSDYQIRFKAMAF